MLPPSTSRSSIRMVQSWLAKVRARLTAMIAHSITSRTPVCSRHGCKRALGLRRPSTRPGASRWSDGIWCRWCWIRERSASLRPGAFNIPVCAVAVKGSFGKVLESREESSKAGLPHFLYSGHSLLTRRSNFCEDLDKVFRRSHFEDTPVW